MLTAFNFITTGAEKRKDMYDALLLLLRCFFLRYIKIRVFLQFSFYFDKGDEEIIRKAYDVLKDGANVELPLGPCEWTSLIFCLVDKFGVNWLLCIE